MQINSIPTDMDICCYCGGALETHYDYSCILCTRETCDGCSQVCFECDDITCSGCIELHMETRHPRIDL